jgi:hypothetical protein
MDKKLLGHLNSLQYSDKEIEEMERQASKQEIDMDEYFIRNASLKKKLAVETLKKSIETKLEQDEVIERSLIVNSGIYQIPSIATWGASIHYYLTLTNKRLFVVGLDFDYKYVDSYVKCFEEINGIVEEDKNSNLYGIRYGIAMSETTITLSSREEKDSIKELIEILKGKGIKKIRYKDTNSEKTVMIIGIVLIVFFLLIMLPSIFRLI